MELHITGRVSEFNQRLDAVSVKCSDSYFEQFFEVEVRHVTLSCASGIEPKEAHSVAYEPRLEDLSYITITGKIGVETTSKKAKVLPGVSKKVMKKVILENFLSQYYVEMFNLLLEFPKCIL